jgi:hypothetical protein
MLELLSISLFKSDSLIYNSLIVLFKESSLTVNSLLTLLISIWLVCTWLESLVNLLKRFFRSLISLLRRISSRSTSDFSARTLLSLSVRDLINSWLDCLVCNYRSRIPFYCFNTLIYSKYLASLELNSDLKVALLLSVDLPTWLILSSKSWMSRVC